MLREREKNILEIVVREYIRTAEPISSEKIALRMKNSLSPASIRNIFTELTRDGYIEQPHTSSGRIPKTKGYRFFVNRVLDGTARTPLIPSDIETLLENAESGRTLQEVIARQFHVLSCIAGFSPVGFNEVFREPEFTSETHVRELGRFLDGLDSYTDELEEELERGSFRLMIGDENDIQPISHISIFITKTPDDEMFFMTGPIRMPYDKIIGFVNLWKTKQKRK